MPWQEQLREHRVCFDSQFKGTAHPMGKSRQLELELLATSHSHEAVNAPDHGQVILPQLTQQDGHPQAWPEAIPDRCVWRLISKVALDSVKLTSNAVSTHKTCKNQNGQEQKRRFPHHSVIKILSTENEEEY